MARDRAVPVTEAEIAAAALAVATEYETNPAAWVRHSYATDADGDRVNIGPQMVSGCVLGKMYQHLGYEGHGYELDYTIRVEGDGTIRNYLSSKLTMEDKLGIDAYGDADIAVFSNMGGPALTAAFLRRAFPITPIAS